MAVARHSYSTTGVKGNILRHHVALMAPVRPGVLRGRRPVGGSGRLRGFIGGLHRPSTHSVPPGGHPRGNPGTCVFPRTLSGFGLPSYISSEIGTVGYDHVTTHARNCFETGGVLLAICEFAHFSPYNGLALNPRGTWRNLRDVQPQVMHRVAVDGPGCTP